jgi:hypothetical protein
MGKLDDLISVAEKKLQEDAESRSAVAAEQRRRQEAERLNHLRETFETLVGEDARGELRPKYSVSGSQGAINLHAKGVLFEVEIRDLNSPHGSTGLYVRTGGKERRHLRSIDFNAADFQYHLLAGIGKYLKEAGVKE